jgi:hypothetical protein
MKYLSENHIPPRSGKAYNFGDMGWNWQTEEKKQVVDGNSERGKGKKKVEKRDPTRKYWYIYLHIPKTQTVRHILHNIQHFLCLVWERRTLFDDDNCCPTIVASVSQVNSVSGF